MMFHSTELCTRVLIAGESDAGSRLDVFVARELNVSRERAKRLVLKATLRGAPVKPSRVVENGDEIIVPTEPKKNRAEQPMFDAGTPAPKLPPIIFEDDHLLVVNKPRGLAVHEGAGDNRNILVEILRFHGRVLSSVGPMERHGIVHRLDKDTSGVLIVCKSDAAHWKLAADFAARRVTKEYAALVCGVPPSAGRIEAPIERHPVHRKKMAVMPGGRSATTEYSVQKSWSKFALLKVQILTGRTHQIRVHLQYVNYPVVGDAVYGGLKRALENAPNDQALKAIESLNGQALHAARIEFEHPATNEVLSFGAPLPDEFQNVIVALDNTLIPNSLSQELGGGKRGEGQ